MKIYYHIHLLGKKIALINLHNLRDHVALIYISFFLISKERGQTSRGIIDILTRLAPRETSIVCRQTQNILLRKGEKDLQKEGELDQNPQNEQKRKETEETSKTFKRKTDLRHL